MRVVKLDGDFFRQRIPIGVVALEASYKIGKRAGHEKIFLHEPQSLSEACGVVRGEYAREGLGLERLGHRTDEISVTECLKLKVIGGFRRPEAKCVDVLAAVTNNGAIKGDADQTGCLTRDRAQGPALHLERAIQLDFNFLVRARDFPR